MYEFLTAVNATLFIYVAWAWIAPSTALFFIRDKERRRRKPICLWLTLGYLAVFCILAPLVQNTEGYKVEQAEKAEQERLALAKEAQEVAAQRQDSILRADIDLLINKGHISQDGPTDALWRYQQWLLAKRDSINLAYVNYQLDNLWDVEKGSPEFFEYDRLLTNAANPKWTQKSKYRSYYENATEFTDSARIPIAWS